MIYNIIKKSEIEDSFKNQFKRVTLLVLISLTVIQQMPLIKDLYYSQIRLTLYMVFGMFSAISCLNINKLSKIYFIRYFILTIAYTFILFIVIKVFKGVSFEVLELIIPFGVLICSLNTYFDKKQLSNFLVWYVILSAILGISSIFYYGQGFTITRNYFLIGKNQIGPLIGISATITGIWILNKKQFYLNYDGIFLKVFIFIALISSILVIRNRSGLLGVSVVAIFALIKEYEFRIYKKSIVFLQCMFIVIVCAFVLGLFDGLIDIIFRSIFENYNIADINSISAGRTDVYKMAVEFIGRHPILGKLGSGEVVFSTPHNYILNKWVNYGVLLSLPIVLFYLYLWYFAIIEIKKNNNKTSYSLPVWVLLFSLIVSLVEYTYPYGPGVSQLMVWFLLGQYFKHNSKARITIEE